MALALMCWSTSGCLAADEPTFPEPVKTVPFLLTQTANPPVTKPIVAFSNTLVNSVELSVQVRSEDAGDPLVAKLVYSYPPGIDLGVSSKFPPGKLGDTGRILSLTLSKVPLDESKVPPGPWTGCLQVSMLVTHESNTEPTNGITFTNPEDISVITWWFSIPGPGGELATLAQCTRPGTAP
jgi:hypothetical protein